MHKVKFSYSKPGGDRRYYINGDDVSVLLERLPYQLWQMLKAVYFNDRGAPRIRLGYVNRGRREIAICALPPRVSVNWLRPSGEANHWGATRGAQWPTLAVRRFLLYHVFLHELGHLQIILPDRTNPRRKYGGEGKAEEFAKYWRKKLWAKKFDHPDPVHNPPSRKELEMLKRGWVKAHNLYKKGLNLDGSKDTEKAMSYYRQAIEIYPDHTQALERVGMLTYEQNETGGSADALKQAEAWLKHALSIDPLLPHAGKYLELVRKRMAE